MRIGLWLLVFLGFGGLAWADNSVDDGFTAAEELCAKQLLPSDVRQCLKIAREAKYFDVGAVEACGRQFLPSDVLKCLSGIRDKEYRASILDACGRLFLPSEILACLVENGKPWVETAVDLEKARAGILLAIQYLRGFELRRAEAKLYEVLKLLEE